MIRIRQAAIQDNELLAEIGSETFYDSFAADNTPEDMAAYLSASFNPAKQGIELADSQSRFLIAEINDEVVGYTQLRFSPVPQVIAGQKPIEIARFYARKQWIGKGIGAHLMRGCIQEAKAAGCDAIWLDVWDRNLRAIAFYRNWGFTEVGEQTFQLGNDLQHDLLMAKPLSINE
jgi:ribosomal protein S18 acetylase RimI-like enzyme